MPLYTINLPCFNKAINFNVPDIVRRSTTADIVRTGQTDNNQQAGIFSQIRTSPQCQSERQAWRDAVMAYEQFASTSPQFLLLEENIKQTSAAYKNALLFMAERSGIWNCGEFADFALITIYEQQGLVWGNYTAKNVTLNNPKMPEQQQDRNHDHAFVLIMNRQQKPLFVIDLWQSLVTGRPFAGTVGSYIQMLQKTPDGRYVRADIVQQHISQIDNISLQRASGNPNNREEFINFFNRTRVEIENIHKAHGFDGKYRTTSGGIKYDRHLTPPVSRLSPDQKVRIGSDSRFALRSKSQTSLRVLPETYDHVFDFPDDTNTMGHANHITNIVRCLYDLSFRYQDNELFAKAQDLIVAYVKHYNVEVNSQSIVDILNGVFNFFNVDRSSLIPLINRLEDVTVQKNLTAQELAVLQEFIYICPAPETLQARMRYFYEELFARINNHNADTLDTAAWIIKALCDIHPFDDGNGRVARTLACNLIRNKMHINFTKAEIINFGEDQHYKDITSRMNTVPESVAIGRIKEWLSVMCENKLKSQNKYFSKLKF